MDDQAAVVRNLARQREWYGEPLGDRVRRLVVAYDVSQAQLAEVLGLSPPMLSQLMSGRRAKIGNPAVLARMVMLERRVLTPSVASGDPAAIRAALEQVRDSRPTLGHELLPSAAEPHGTAAPGTGETADGADPGAAVDPGDAGSVDGAAVTALRRVAGAEELTAAAGVLQDGFPRLAALLRRAAHAAAPSPPTRADGTGEPGTPPRREGTWRRGADR